MEEEWDDMAVQVINLCGTAFSRTQIIKDLKHTRSVEETVNRVFDGLFLSGITSSSTCSSVQKTRIEQQARKPVEVFIIDSSSGNDCEIVEVKKNKKPRTTDLNLNPLPSDEDDDLSFLNRPTFPSSSILLPRSKFPIPSGPQIKLPKSKTGSAPNTTKVAADGGDGIKALAAAEKKRLKEEERERKNELKNQVLKEKQAHSQIKSANILKQKVTCAEEMIISICDKWSADENAKAIVASLTGAGAVVIPKPLKIPYAMSFTRKVDREFDFKKGAWAPCERKHEMEPYALFLLSAERLIGIISEDSENGLLSFFKRCTEVYPEFTIVWIVENLQEYYKKRAHAKSRKENDELRGLMGQSVPKRSKGVDFSSSCDRELIEEQLLYLQLIGTPKIRIHPCSSTETAGWIVSFTQQIAFYPEQYVRTSSSLGLTFGDSVKSGKGAKETWQKMLQHIPGVSESVGRAITEKYPTCADFLELISSKSTSDATSLLVAIPFLTNGKSKTIGKIVATRIVEVLTGRGRNLVMDA